MGSGLGQALGFDRATPGFDPEVNSLQNTLQMRASDPNGIATTAYKGMANQGMGNVLAGIAQTKGLRPAAQATMADIAGSRIQGQTAEQAGLMGMQEQQQNQNMLMNLLMNRNQQDVDSQNQQAGRLANTFWKGVNGAGAAFSGGGAM